MPKKVYGPLDAYKQVSMYMHLTGIHNATIAVECQDEKLSCVTEQMRENIKR